MDIKTFGLKENLNKKQLAVAKSILNSGASVTRKQLREAVKPFKEAKEKMIRPKFIIGDNVKIKKPSDNDNGKKGKVTRMFEDEVDVRIEIQGIRTFKKSEVVKLTLTEEIDLPSKTVLDLEESGESDLAAEPGVGEDILEEKLGSKHFKRGMKLRYKDDYVEFKNYVGNDKMKSVVMDDKFNDIVVLSSNLMERFSEGYKDKFDARQHAYDMRKQGKSLKEIEAIIGNEFEDPDDTDWIMSFVESLDLKHADKPDTDFDPVQLNKGLIVEKEHTDDEEVAKGIAKAHIIEDEKYYDKLEIMEANKEGVNGRMEEPASAEEMKRYSRLYNEGKMSERQYKKLIGAESACVEQEITEDGEVEESEILLENYFGHKVTFKESTGVAKFEDGSEEDTNIDTLHNDGFEEAIVLKVGDEVETISGPAVIEKVYGTTVLVKTKPSSDFPNQNFEYRKEDVSKI